MWNKLKSLFNRKPKEPKMRFSYYLHFYWRNKEGQEVESYQIVDTDGQITTSQDVKNMIKHLEKYNTSGQPVIIRWWQELRYVKLDPKKDPGDDKGGEHY